MMKKCVWKLILCKRVFLNPIVKLQKSIAGFTLHYQKITYGQRHIRWKHNVNVKLKLLKYGYTEKNILAEMQKTNTYYASWY